MAGIEEIGFVEYDGNTANSIVTPAYCLVDKQAENTPRLCGKLDIKVSRDSIAYVCYRKTEVREEFNCNYELNPEYRPALEANGMRISGESERGSARIVELPGHRFYLATGFLPQLISEQDRPHPLITGFLNAAMNYRKSKG